MELDVIMIDVMLFQIHTFDAHHLLPDLAPTAVAPDDQVEFVRLARYGLVVDDVVVLFRLVGLDGFAGVLVALAGLGVGRLGGPIDRGEFGGKVERDVSGETLDET